MKYVLVAFSIMNCCVIAAAQSGSQNLRSPSEFLGYTLGERFSYHHKVLDYFKYVESQSKNVLLHEYGKTYEGRELVVAFLSSPQNLANLDDIKRKNLVNAGLMKGSQSENNIGIIWFSYNIHGNEANSTETSMKVLHDLVSNPDKYADWLESMVIVIDPCLNPDGRDRYVNWYHQVANAEPNPNILTREHQEGWTRGRTNHYLFDLNRDWFWQTQKESKQRLKLYNEWMPHVHVDFHEQYPDNEYYFAPAAEPYHETITDWQREFQKIAGRDNANYFDKKGWLYYTREIFDLLYPGYGDTYPMYNGAIGMTYEMPGHSVAGLAVETKKGDTLSLKKRIEMHHATSMTTLETCYNHRKKLLLEFSNFFREREKSDRYYILKADKQDRIDILRDLLDKHQIKYYSGSTSKSVKGQSFNQDRIVEIAIQPRDLIVPVAQPKSTLVEVMFERNTKLSDTLTYDITAWSLPYVYGLDAYAANGKIDLVKYQTAVWQSDQREQQPYAYILNWTSMRDAKFLASVLKMGYKVNYSTKEFEYDGKSHSAGTLIFNRQNNQHQDFGKELLLVAEAHKRQLIPLYSGAALATMDLGSNKIKYLKKPRVAMLSGAGISSSNFGELWYFFEQELNYSVDIFEKQSFSRIDLTEYNVIILASGKYPNLQKEEVFQNIDSWVKHGGKLILVDDAISDFVGESKFLLKEQKPEKDENEIEEVVLYPYENSERENIKNNILGSIIKMELDNTHSLAYGYGNYYYTLKHNNKTYDFLKDGWNVGYISSPEQAVAGYIGSASKDKLKKNLSLGVEHRGNGRVIYFVDDPVFRAFWQNGKLFLANALFFDNN